MESTSPFAFLRVLEALKNIQRKGWAKRGIQSPESVSDHMYCMAVMVWMIPEVCSQRTIHENPNCQLLDCDEVRIRAVKMALAHDMGEAIVGDIISSDGVPRGIVCCALSVEQMAALGQLQERPPYGLQRGEL